MSFENSTSGRRYLKWAGIGLALVIAACSLLPAQDRPSADRLIPGKIPERTPGHLMLAWPDEALIRKAREMHPFDLQGRMELALSAMTSCTDPDLSYLSYSYGTFNARPAWMQHCLGDFVDDTGRHTDAMWMIRSATDSRLNDQVIRKMARNGMDVVEDGIAWDPPQEPFTWYGAGAKPTDRWTHLPEATRVILGMMSYYRATDDPRALETVRSMVHQLYKIASKDDRYLWYPDFNYERSGGKILPLAVAHGQLPRLTKPADGAGGAGNWPAAFMGMMILPSMRYYEQTKDPVAVELVTRFRPESSCLRSDHLYGGRSCLDSRLSWGSYAASVWEP